jgi:putative redox protein
MGIVAERHQIDIVGTRVRVTKEMATQPVRRIARLTVEFQIPAEKGRRLGDADRKRLETAALTCPVHASLHPEIAIPITWNYGA